MKYNAKFFRDGMPDWKKKKDSIFACLIYRPISFWGICGKKSGTGKDLLQLYDDSKRWLEKNILKYNLKFLQRPMRHVMLFVQNFE